MDARQLATVHRAREEGLFCAREGSAWQNWWQPKRDGRSDRGQLGVKGEAATYKSGLAESLLLVVQMSARVRIYTLEREDLRCWLLLLVVDGGGATLVEVADAGGEPAAGGLAAVILCACAPFSAIPCALLSEWLSLAGQGCRLARKTSRSSPRPEAIFFQDKMARSTCIDGLLAYEPLSCLIKFRLPFPLATHPRPPICANENPPRDQLYARSLT